MNAVFVGFDNFLSRMMSLTLIWVFGAMNVVFLGFDNFLSRETKAVFHVDLGFGAMNAVCGAQTVFILLHHHCF